MKTFTLQAPATYMLVLLLPFASIIVVIIVILGENSRGILADRIRHRRLESLS